MKMKVKSKISKLNKEPLLPHIIIITFCVLCLLAFLIVLSVSFSKESDIMKYGYSLWPKTFSLTAFKYVFANPQSIIDAYKVTAITTIVGTILSVLIMAMIAYPLSKSTFKHKKSLSFMVFFTMLFSGGLVPVYILITKYLNLYNNIWVYILPGLVNAWHIILLRTFFQTISPSIIESAKLDGASEFTIFFKLVLPLSTAALATVALFGALGRWNDWFTSMLYVDDPKLLTLQYMLQRIMMNVELLKQNITNVPAGMLDKVEIPSETVTMAMVVVATGPMLFVFPFFQKYFVKGIMVGSVKG